MVAKCLSTQCLTTVMNSDEYGSGFLEAGSEAFMLFRVVGVTALFEVLE